MMRSTQWVSIWAPCSKWPRSYGGRRRRRLRRSWANWSWIFLGWRILGTSCIQHFWMVPSTFWPLHPLEKTSVVWRSLEESAKFWWWRGRTFPSWNAIGYTCRSLNHWRLPNASTFAWRMMMVRCWWSWRMWSSERWSPSRFRWLLRRRVHEMMSKKSTKFSGLQVNLGFV